jgi:hypothetical protein
VNLFNRPEKKGNRQSVGFCRNMVAELELRWHVPTNQKAKL